MRWKILAKAWNNLTFVQQFSLPHLYRCLSSVSYSPCLYRLVKPNQFGLPDCNNDVKYGLYWQNSRGYAKGKDKGRDKKKGKKKVEVNLEELSEIVNVDSLTTGMQKCIDHLKDEYIQNLSLRSTTGSIETLEVTFEGKEYELQELAEVVRKNPRTVVINMSVFPQAIPDVLRSIQKSGMNLNPQQDGTTVFIPIPKVTKEHRENLAKSSKALFIKCRDSIREVQNKFLKTLKNKPGLSEDKIQEVQEQIISLGDKYIAEGEKIFEMKQAELIGKD